VLSKRSVFRLAGSTRISHKMLQMAQESGAAEGELVTQWQRL